ncbi:MAG TPA: PEP/pyruvate-binding domain-containing protein [Symbiobacteriaceae bacterium]|nr:PEP/pyruvate-binding domain-containing protein [Symbiobacteriaceae bacterium]
MASIHWFDQVDRDSLAWAGGKGANLGVMTRTGLPVPPGFVVSAEAYRLHLRSAGLEQKIRGRLRETAMENLAAVEAACADITGWITRTPVDSGQAEEIRNAYETLSNRVAVGEVPVAVRSSATAEDLPDASFAGQQETYLNVLGTDELVDAVRRCWASLWGARAVAYRHRMGYDHMAVSLAVVVQAMVPSEVAGVMFTANPVTGARNQFVITGSYGLGESVVSGLVTPDTFVVSTTGAVIERTLGSKEEQIRPTAVGTETLATPLADRSRYCLSDLDLERLAELGRRVTAHYGAPQDIEWGLAGGRFFLLQARPITTLGEEPVGDAAPVKMGWFERRTHERLAANVIDHFPDPIKPLDYTVVTLAFEGLFAMLTSLGFRTPPGGMSLVKELPDGRVALNLDLPQVGLTALWHLPARLIRALGEDPYACWEEVKGPLVAHIEEVERLRLDRMSEADLSQTILNVLEVFREYVPIRFRIFPCGLLHDSLAKRWIRKAVGKAEADAVTRQLFLALPYRTAQMNRAITQLAQTAARSDKVSPEFQDAFAQVVADWGHRPTRGMVGVPGFPTWREDLATIHGLVDALLNDPGALDLEGLDRRQQEEYAAARVRVTARLRQPVRRWFERSLDLARGYLLAREESHDTFDRASEAMRRVLLTLGGRLAARGALVEAADIFFTLLPTEFDELMEGSAAIRDRIARRKRAYAKVCAAQSRGENWLVASGTLPPEPVSNAETNGEGYLLKGLPASPGRARGRVCVVRDPSEFGKLHQGDILVAPATAPAWTPLFSLAAAVVTDTGGALSHASIVAREYGIPAVLATGKATTSLRDGQCIMVDGSTGLITAAAEEEGRSQAAS